MSKSLKNFITIKEALEKYSPLQLRFLFLLHQWDGPMDFSDATMSHAVSLERQFAEFFGTIKDILRKADFNGNLHFGALEKGLLQALRRARSSVHAALCDSINTPAVMNELRDLMRACTKYLSENGANTAILQSIARWMTEILRIFGCVTGSDDIGFARGAGAASGEDALAPVLDALTAFRSGVRAAARDKDFKQVLDLCDDVRDNALPECGVRLQDTADGATWKLDDKDTLMQEKARRDEIAEEKRKMKLAREQREREKLERAKVPPGELFRRQGDKYSEFDDKGLPTKDAAGEPLSKKALKKLVKEFEQHAKLHEQYLASEPAAE